MWSRFHGLRSRRRVEAGPLGSDRLAENDRAGLAEIGDHRRILLNRRRIFAKRRAALRRHAGDVDDVLDADGDAVQRAGDFASPGEVRQPLGLAPRPLFIDQYPGVDAIFELMNPREAVIYEVAGREPAGADVVDGVADGGEGLHCRRRSFKS